ncbi:hypothetical protein H5410_020956 [Solanum commersonii]|uniref:RNase H type-1 domain-containing protein n=1 Tax=Solanum commersonii TaxID=4109 RepID=A0A9J5Z9J5_SOLCO|nr:hypothetical protein H5410_020956 [Solanum commersonii]
MVILPITFGFICWNLWKNRCSAKYGDKKSSSLRVKFLIFKDMKNLLTTEIKIISVHWEKPQQNVYKLNTDASAMTNQGRDSSSNSWCGLVHTTWCIQDLQRLINQVKIFKCNHIYREANCTTDFLSKWSHNSDIVLQFYTYQQFLRLAKGIYVL